MGQPAIVGDPPLNPVVYSHQEFQNVKRTVADNVSFESPSVSEDGQVIEDRRMTYRSLGGIYAKRNHCHLY